MPVGQPPIFDSPEQMQIQAQAYIDKCSTDKVRPTITRLCYELGFESRQSFYDYEKRDEFSYTVKRLRLFIESGYEAGLSENGCAGSIFALKNMGWKDTNRTELTGPDGKPIQHEAITGMVVK